MKLSFLGANYTPNTQKVETLETETTATFLGNRYYVRRPVQSAQSSHLGLRKYRGVAY